MEPPVDEKQQPETKRCNSKRLFEQSSSDFVLAEYNSLRAELLQRVATRYQIMTLGFTAFSAVLAVQAFGGGNSIVSVYIVLLYPILSFFLMNVYISNSLKSSKLEDYIRRVEQFVKDNLPVEASNNFGWLLYSKEQYGNDRIAFKYPFTFAGRFVFPATALVTTVAAFPLAWPDFTMWLTFHKGTLLAYLFAGDLVCLVVSLFFAISTFSIFRLA